MRFTDLQLDPRGRSTLAVLLALVLTLASCAAPSWRDGRSTTGSNDGAKNSVEFVETSHEDERNAQPEFDAAAWFAEHTEDPEQHGVLIETMEPGRTIAAHNAEKKFNPASIIKLATTLVALRKLGPGYRFRIHVYAKGEVDQNGTLHGDLYFIGSAPTFGDVGANMFAKELEKRGIKRVEGKVKVSPDFCFNLSDSPQTSGERLVKDLRLEKQPETEVVDAPEGKLILVFNSHPLREILLYMNAHSSNFVAHRVGDRVGGPKGVQWFLENEVGIPSGEVLLSTTSGLEHNQMTARGIAKLIRALVAETERHGLTPSDIMPVATDDTGTLRRRLDGTDLEGALLGKSGTLTTTDGGMASLAGIVYAENSEPLLFVVLDQGTLVWKNRDLQEKFLAEVLKDRLKPRRIEIEKKRDLLTAESMTIEDRGGVAVAPSAMPPTTATAAE